MAELDLVEWEVADPSTHPVLKDRSLATVQERMAAVRWRKALRIDETRAGLRIRTRQHVGVVQLGDLRIRIRPKLPVSTLWPLLAYGLGLEVLPERPPVDFAWTGDMPELLASMLLSEAKALRRGGLARGYTPQESWLETPRGRIDLGVLARNLPLSRAALPCAHHDFSTDILCNQVVSSGLHIASRWVRSPLLRSALHAESVQWREQCQSIALTSSVLAAADRERSRLIRRYTAAHTVVRALFERSGPAEDLGSGDEHLPGALWNMASLFERAVARYLKQHLPAPWVVDPQHRLRHLYSVSRGAHAHSKPVPRPDLVVRDDSGPVAVLDTKYRDLSVTRFPPSMLYQMSVYSLAFGGERPIPSVVLYAVPSGARDDVTITLNVKHGLNRTILLRAVPLDDMVATLGTGEEPEEALRWLHGHRADRMNDSSNPSSNLYSP